VFSAPLPPPIPGHQRVKQLQLQLGPAPTASDFGAEADLVSPRSHEPATIFTKKWLGTIRAYLRAPMRVGLGPRNDDPNGDGRELHTPPRVVGLLPSEWTYVGLTPPAAAALYFTVENNRVSGNVIIETNTMTDAGYDHLNQIGGVAQAYVTLKFPEVFADHGGLAWTVGGFSDRYGMAGPEGKSAGYYGTYLFGRTHTVGERLTADIDVTPDIEIVVEHGFGAKLEVVPFVAINHTPPPPTAPYLPYQGPVPLGSNYIHHAHAEAIFSNWLTLGAHYLTSWSPNDFSLPCTATADPNSCADERTSGEKAKEARLTVFGGDVHIDSRKAGNGYLGFSQVKADHILPLSNGIEVIHGMDGFGFKENYFGKLEPINAAAVATQLGWYGPHEDSGTVQTLLAQYLIRLAPLLGRETYDGPDAALAVFGMFNHIDPIYIAHAKHTQDRLKFGTELEVSPLPYLAVGARYDNVMPDGGNAALGYSAVSPRIIFHTTWLGREYIMLNYTHYFLGSGVVPSEQNPTAVPYTPYVDPPIAKPDPDLFVLSAQVSF
jgi:hypothetical protein